MLINYSYKSYKVSKSATVFSIIGAIFYTLGKIMPMILILELIKAFIGSDSIRRSNLRTVIIFTILATLAMFAIGLIFNIIGKKIARKKAEKYMELPYGEVVQLINKKPELKEFFMENHRDYKQANENNEICNEDFNIETINLDKNDTKEEKKKKLLRYYGTIAVIGITIAIGVEAYNKYYSPDNKLNYNINSTESTAEAYNDGKVANAFDDFKYQTYINFNNDIVFCYEASIDPYLDDKGINEAIESDSDNNEVNISPILETKYKNLETARSVVDSKPKMDIDEDIPELTDAVEKVYDLVNEIYYVYGGRDYGKETNKTKEELHKEFLIAIKEYDTLYAKFGNKLDELSIEYMSKELETYKKSGDMDSYETLNIMIESQKIYRYFIDNNITNENLFDINLEEYNKLLESYNKAYEEFENQNIKGSTVHTGTFIKFAKAYHSFVNNVVDMVNQKNFNSGEIDAEKGFVAPNEEDDIQERLYFYVDRMISDYNSIQSFKE